MKQCLQQTAKMNSDKTFSKNRLFAQRRLRKSTSQAFSNKADLNWKCVHKHQCSALRHKSKTNASEHNTWRDR